MSGHTINSQFDDDIKDLVVRALEARGAVSEQQGDILGKEIEDLRGQEGFREAFGLEDRFLGLAEDFLDPEAQQTRFASVRERLLGDRARQGLFGGTGDESVSIQGLAALDDLRRQDIGFARQLSGQSFFNPAGFISPISQEGLVQSALGQQQFGAELGFNRRVARATGKAVQQGQIGQLLGTLSESSGQGAPGAGSVGRTT